MSFSVPSPPHQNQGSVPDAEQQARAWLAGGKFRKARDAFKLLCKQDRDRYLPDLIQANIGLAREMLAKGQASEAQQVIAYLKTIAPANAVAPLEVEAASRSNNVDAATTTAQEVLAHPPPTLSARDRLRLADHMVLNFDSRATTPDSAAVMAEVKLVQDALQAITRQDGATATERLRPIGHQSPVAHWKLLIKGMIAFYQSDTARAAKCFEAVDTETIPGRIGAAYLLLCRPAPPAAAMANGTMHLACHLAGYPSLGQPLARAEQAWRSGNWSRSYDILRDSIAKFPSESPDAVGAISDFHFQVLHVECNHDSEKLASHLDRMNQERRMKSTVESKLIRRAISLCYADTGNPMYLKEDWNQFLADHAKLHGHNPRLESIALHWLGIKLSQPISPSGFLHISHLNPVLHDRQGAFEALVRSTRLDPTNKEAFLTLYDLHARLHMTSDANRLLDQMTKLFPDDKHVLLCAARACLDRNTLKRGLDYLDRVRQIDPLDPTVPDMMVDALLRSASQQLQQGKQDNARATLARAEPLLLVGPDHLVRSQWCFLVRRAMLEQRHGDHPQAEQTLAQARELSPSPEAFFFYAHMARLDDKRTARSQQNEFSKAFEKEAKDLAIAQHAPLLMRILRHWTKETDLWGTHRNDCLLMERYLNSASKRPLPRDAVCKTMELVIGTPLETCFDRPLRKWIDRVLRDDPADPTLNLYRYQIDHIDGRRKTVTAINNLESIIAEARRRNEHVTVQRAEKELAVARRDIESAHGPIPPPRSLPPVDMDDDDVDAAADVEDASLPPTAFDDLTGMALPSPETLDALARQIVGLSEADLKKLRREACKTMPPFVFDAMIDVVRRNAGKQSIPPSSPQGKAMPTPEPPPPADPNQRELF
jgi:tetratricopeptide (TPR) repeat protein